jgi:hypothetical protein
MDQAWIEACRAYSRMDDKGRQDYWNQLSPDQKTALGAALSEGLPTEPVAFSLAPKNGCLKTAAMGCTGMILGALLTIAVELLAVAKGVNAVSSRLHESNISPVNAHHEIGNCGNQAARRADLGFDAFCRADERSKKPGKQGRK